MYIHIYLYIYIYIEREREREREKMFLEAVQSFVRQYIRFFL